MGTTRARPPPSFPPLGGLLLLVAEEGAGPVKDLGQDEGRRGCSAACGTVSWRRGSCTPVNIWRRRPGRPDNRTMCKASISPSHQRNPARRTTTYVKTAM